MTRSEKAAVRLNEITAIERPMWESGMTLIAGADEAGRGPLAGPVVAAAVIMPPDDLIPGIDDSKRLSEKKRELLYEQIREKAVAVGIGIVSMYEIDTMNILEATRKAFCLSVADLHMTPDHLFTDAMDMPADCPVTAMIKGDQKIYSVAAASIVAKVTRDRLMNAYAQLFPEYGFERHKGYGTPEHRAAILSHGVLPVHRQTFVRKILAAKGKSIA